MKHNLQSLAGESWWDLLSWYLDRPVPHLRLYPPVLSEEDEEHLLPVLQRLATGMPLAYALGRAPFHGRWFSVSPDVLIPRQESEELVDHVLVSSGEQVTLVDAGTGSGCLAVTLALHGKWKRVYGVDVSPLALVVAEGNVGQHQAPVSLQQHDVTSSVWGAWMASLATEGPLVLVANLPYIPSAVVDDLDPEVREYEPRLALDGGRDGTDCLRGMFHQLLSHGVSAQVYLELDEDNFQPLTVFAEERGLTLAWRRDAAGLLRFCDISLHPADHG